MWAVARKLIAKTRSVMKVFFVLMWRTQRWNLSKNFIHFLYIYIINSLYVIYIYISLFNNFRYINVSCSLIEGWYLNR